MTKDLMKKKFYLITLMDFESKTLAIFGIKVIAKLGSVTYWVKPEDRSKNKIKAKPEKHNLME